MTKLVLDFGRVTRIMRVKLTVIVDDENDPKTSKFTKVVEKSNYKGVEYLRITPHPYITLDISAGKDKSEDWNGNLQINLNTMYKYALCRKLKKLIKCFTELEDLFIVDEEGRLHVNKDESKKASQELLTNNGAIRIAPVVVYKNTGDTSSGVEGAVFMINTIDNYCTFTYAELQYFYDLLENMDMMAYAMDLITMNKVYSKEDIEVPQVNYSEVKSPDITKATPIVKSPDTIPDLS